MLKKVVTYTDYNGEEVKEVLLFSMSVVDTSRFVSKYTDFSNISGDDEDSINRALRQYLNKITSAKDLPKIIAFIEDFILSSYGEISPDGRRFIKSKTAREEFEESIPYAVLFEELLGTEGAMNKFMSAVLEEKGKSNSAPAVQVVK